MLVLGPMFAGKTRHLIEHTVRPGAVIRPRHDTRTSAWVAHDGTRPPPDVAELRVNDFELLRLGLDECPVTIDEAQFFGPQALLTFLRHRRAPTLVGALSGDYTGAAFPTIAAVLPLAQRVVYLRGTCAVCGYPSTHTKAVAPLTSNVVVGGADLYVPVCAEHHRPTL